MDADAADVKYEKLWNALKQIISDTAEDRINESVIAARTYAIIQFLGIKSLNELSSISFHKSTSTRKCGTKTIAEIIDLFENHRNQHRQIQLGECR